MNAQTRTLFAVGVPKTRLDNNTTRTKTGERESKSRNFTYFCKPKRALIPPIPAETEAKSGVAILLIPCAVPVLTPLSSNRT